MVLTANGQLAIPAGQQTLWIRSYNGSGGRAKIGALPAFNVSDSEYVEKNCARQAEITNLSRIALSVEWSDPN